MFNRVTVFYRLFSGSSVFKTVVFFERLLFF